MGLIGGELGYRLLKAFFPAANRLADTYVEGGDKIERLLGRGFWDEVKGKVVIDFGCGTGAETIAIAKAGAALACGIDIREEVLEVGRRGGEGIANLRFGTSCDLKADLIVSLDAFEHFDRPNDILRIMASLLQPNGQVVVSFGPTWYHPLGGHLFSVFPWAHLLFTERALVRWRDDFKSDGATRFSEVAGGLNQMTIRRFEELVAKSPLRADRIECVPIRAARWFHGRPTREFLTAIVRARLSLRQG